jgi:hypothetical protein
MSTKDTIASGPNFNLYCEVLDEDTVYLELEGQPFEASHQGVTVAIPVAIWELIRRYPASDLAFAKQTDAQLRQYVEQQVDARIRQYHEAPPERRPLFAALGALPFGTADLPREQQIAAGMDYYMRVREHQQQIIHAIAELERMNRQP